MSFFSRFVKTGMLIKRKNDTSFRRIDKLSYYLSNI